MERIPSTGVYKRAHIFISQGKAGHSKKFEANDGKPRQKESREKKAPNGPVL
jgi:hypothetical protein